MALIQCYECEKEISDQAPACPHCGAPKEALPPQIEEAEILESVAVVDEPEPITPETVSAPSTEHEPVAIKDERFNQGVAFAVGAFVFMIARALGVSDVSMAVYQASGELASLLVAALIGFILLAAPIVLLRKYGKKQLPQAYAGILGALVVVFGIAIAAGPGDVFIQPPVSTREVGPTPSASCADLRSRGDLLSEVRTCAEQGNARAQEILGIRYSAGTGLPVDNVLAYMWLNLAAAQEQSITAPTFRDLTAQKMTREQIAEAQRMSREWLEAHPSGGN